ncbi:MAG: lysine 2,3-aminomutase [Melioribacteraceae bacterium]|nr:lysine 2,3-aminomutase [Melioribacteraceae bacterium]
MKFYGMRDLDRLPQLTGLSEHQKFEIKVVSHVLPFRTNSYIVDELIDWNNIPNDPMFQLTFVQKEMLEPEHFNKMAKVISRGSNADEIKSVSHAIRMELKPHPAGQMTANVPLMDDEPVPGVQHKYRETCLVFPSSGQTCHAYCTFCFRWAQFVGINDLKFATDESKRFQKYIREHKELTDVLFTGGDPMVMTLPKLEAYILPLLEPEFDHIQNIRIGTKSLSYWPYKYVTDKDADGIMRLFEKVVESGKHLAIMAHFSHWVELQTPVVREAIKRIRNTGAEIRSQSPVLRHINDNAAVWSRMWKEQVKMGIIPYYMFVERKTGAENYFEIPLYKTFEIFREAYTSLSGLHRTVRGPSMSAMPGKVAIDGIETIRGEKVFVLSFIQGRKAEWVRRPFFAKYSETATWLDQLKPAWREEKFFYKDELDQILQEKADKYDNLPNIKPSVSGAA